MTESLKHLYEHWEHDLIFIAKITGESNPSRCIIRLLKNSKDQYYVFRYFRIGSSWTISADAVQVSLDTALKAIQFDLL